MLVENLNVMTRHTRPKPLRDSNRMGGTQMTPGGRIEKAAPVDVSNVMLVCPVCKLPTRVGMKVKEVKGEHGARPRLQARGLRPGSRHE